VGDQTRLILVLAAIVVLIGLVHSESENGQYYNGEVNASEILEKIEKGDPVEYDHVIVKGNLDLSQLSLPTKHIERTPDEIESYELSENQTVVRSPIRINDSKIYGIVYLNNTLFLKPINLKLSNFNSDASFAHSTFNSGASFWGSNFNSTADFSGSNFNSTANFGDTNFNSTADFSGSDFDGFAGIWGSNFNSTADFSGSDFNNNADFRYSNFNSTANFGDTKFNSNAYFVRSNFNNNADFRYSNFNGFNRTVDFRYSNFNSIANFGGSKFNSNAYFEYSNFNNDAEFEGSNFNRTADFGGSKFNGNASFLDSNFNSKLYVDWAIAKSRLKTTNLKQKYQIYQKLKSEYESLGLQDDAQDAYYEMKVLRAMQSKLDYKFFDIFPRYLYGYGMKPLNPLVLSILSIILFSLIFWRAGIERPLYFSCNTLLSGTGKLLVDTPKLPEKSSNRIKLLFDIERLLGLLFFTLLFISIASTLIK
jgi:hypothetical protein